jgi:choice-of-anchor A domain-containing protein
MINGDVEGRVSVNGGFKAQNFGTAQNLACSAEQALDVTNLVVNGPLNYANGQHFCGSAIALSNVKAPSFAQQSLGAGLAIASSSADLESRTGLDFDATTAFLQQLASQWCGADESNAPVVVNADHSIVARSTTSASVQSFSVSVTDLIAATLFTIDVASSTDVVIINVIGSGALTLNGFDIDTDLPASSIIWTVCDSTEVNVNAMKLMGNLLAIEADVVLENAQVNGNVLARSLTGTSSGQVNIAPCPTTISA